MATKKRCPVCGSVKARVESPSEYKYEHSGLSNVILIGRGIVRIASCDNCEHVTTVVRDEQQLLQAIGLGLLQRPPGMTGEELRYLRTLFDMTQADLASALGLPRRETVAEWEAKERVFAAPRDEITPRLILLNLFRTQIIESDHCFLLPPHIKEYEEFVESFVEYVGRVLSEHKKQKPHAGFSVRLKERKRWSPDLVPA